MRFAKTAPSTKIRMMTMPMTAPVFLHRRFHTSANLFFFLTAVVFGSFMLVPPHLEYLALIRGSTKA